MIDDEAKIIPYDSEELGPRQGSFPDPDSQFEIWAYGYVQGVPIVRAGDLYSLLGPRVPQCGAVLYSRRGPQWEQYVSEQTGEILEKRISREGYGVITINKYDDGRWHGHLEVLDRASSKVRTLVSSRQRTFRDCVDGLDQKVGIYMRALAHFPGNQL